MVRTEADRSGPAAITHAQIAAALSSALGGDITFTGVTPETFAASLQGILPPWQIQGLLEDYAHYRRGEAAVSPAVTKITGKPATDIRQFAHDYAQAFTGQSPARILPASPGNPAPRAGQDAPPAKQPRT
jgi:hypothetical protein